MSKLIYLDNASRNYCKDSLLVKMCKVLTGCRFGLCIKNNCDKIGA